MMKRVNELLHMLLPAPQDQLSAEERVGVLEEQLKSQLGSARRPSLSGTGSRTTDQRFTVGIDDGESDRHATTPDRRESTRTSMISVGSAVSYGGLSGISGYDERQEDPDLAPAVSPDQRTRAKSDWGAESSFANAGEVGLAD